MPPAACTRQIRRLHSRFVDSGNSVRWKKTAVGHFKHDGVLSRCPVPGSAAGRPARQRIARETDTAQLVAVAREYKRDGDTLGCVLQRLGELGSGGDTDADARRLAVEAVTTHYIVPHAAALFAGADPSATETTAKARILASVLMTALHRVKADARVAKAAWHALPSSFRRGGGGGSGGGGVHENIHIRSAALAVARGLGDVAWAEAIWNDRAGAAGDAPAPAERLQYVLCLAEWGRWGEVWSVGIDMGCVAGLLAIATHAGVVDEAWRVWRAARTLGVPPATCDLTALLDFVTKYATIAEVRWALREVDRWAADTAEFIPDARFLLRYASAAAVLYTAAPGELGYYRVYAAAIAAVDDLPPHLKPCRWEAMRLQRLEAAVTTLRFRMTSGQRKGARRHDAHVDVLHKVVGRAAREPMSETMARLGSIFDAGAKDAQHAKGHGGTVDGSTETEAMWWERRRPQRCDGMFVAA